MIKIQDTRVCMEFDSGVFKGRILVAHPQLEYPNKPSKDDIKLIEASVALIINKICTKEVAKK